MDGLPESMNLSLSKLREMAKPREAWHAAVHGVAETQQQAKNRSTMANRQP